MTGRPPSRRQTRKVPVALKGIGRWRGQVYLLFALDRPDIWPAADLGLQLAVAGGGMTCCDQSPNRQNGARTFRVLA
jgi:3-methyladenine DNA glycosylase/8-oxoguanine DNA glycosylase